MNLLCRVCEILNVNFKNIFDDDNIEIIQKLQACTNILIEKDDPLPQFICENCENDLNIAFNFRIKCEQTDFKLRNKLQSIENDLNNEENYLDNSYFSTYNSPIIEIDIIDDEMIENELKNEVDVKIIDEIINEEKQNINKPRKKYNKKKLSSDKSTELSKVYKCETCEVVVEKHSDYIIHIKSHGKQRFQCKICSHWYSVKSKLKRHMDTVHNRNSESVCELCGKTFLHPGNLKRHITGFHEQRKPYKCSSCDKYFARLEVLKQHNATIHSNIRNWQCDVCQKTFKLEIILIIHKRTHLPVGERRNLKKYNQKYKTRVVCSLCGKSCQSKAALKDHLRWHSGEKPFPCTICGKDFSCKENLYQHSKVHTGLKPYKCDICEISFRQSSHLAYHKLTHTGEKPHKCDICKRGFTTTRSRTQHRNLHFGIRTIRKKKVNKK